MKTDRTPQCPLKVRRLQHPVDPKSRCRSRGWSCFRLHPTCMGIGSHAGWYCTAPIMMSEVCRSSSHMIHTTSQYAAAGEAVSPNLRRSPGVGIDKDDVAADTSAPLIIVKLTGEYGRRDLHGRNSRLFVFLLSRTTCLQPRTCHRPASLLLLIYLWQ